ncbi:type IV toxin-antitoxin system AbiEi family antitoxin domain-containing protein [Mesorhizobium sp. VK24D]|uniref:Type IV toxin-antitoxin system AbiEi family antitoxin domain-containing protein n=1 Tax=Mesorhizobium album TaxID=3072314 RepID=A0ABU4YC10_9HYPH|nr:type IV toxin-antitoxin system AbiEi family antitoxin domain-containing protein [Mesorhizobium sp. VK24D]MDX8483489.1 type IV toxin-antitoxin system AbiEi family antitoxin domain-containing protein [Mesorhizobium sp. VK24D]
MSVQRAGKLKQLERLLPEGLLVDSTWLSARGYSTSLRTKYVASGWLEQPARRVYRRPRGQLSWQQAVISLQTLLGHRLAVGGRTALELQGYAHYLSQGGSEVHLHGPRKPPSWLTALRLKEQFVYRNSKLLFGSDLDEVNFPPLVPGADKQGDRSLQDAGLRSLAWGQWDWPLTVSAPERAILELLDELPDHESFHQVDVLMEGLSDLAPRRLQKLLVCCRNVKVKRLFFFFADRHHHAWLKHVERAAVDLGAGKRMLVKEGRYDPAYQITVPKELDEAR